LLDLPWDIEREHVLGVIEKVEVVVVGVDGVGDAVAQLNQHAHFVVAISDLASQLLQHLPLVRVDAEFPSGEFNRNYGEQSARLKDSGLIIDKSKGSFWGRKSFSHSINNNIAGCRLPG
jgi:hypothetical protein